MIIELNEKEVIMVVGALTLLNKVEKDKDLDSLRAKITKQHIEELKKFAKAQQEEGNA